MMNLGHLPQSLYILNLLCFILFSNFLLLNKKLGQRGSFVGKVLAVKSSDPTLNHRTHTVHEKNQLWPLTPYVHYDMSDLHI